MSQRVGWARPQPEADGDPTRRARVTARRSTHRRRDRGPLLHPHDQRAGDENAGVLKHGDSFVVFDRHGDIRPLAWARRASTTHGTRFLSAWCSASAGERPLLLGSTPAATTRDWRSTSPTPTSMAGDRMLRASTLHVSRTMVLWAAACHERIELRNYGLEPVTVPVALRFAADFVDMFEVRGTQRARRGSLRAAADRQGSRARSATTGSTACAATRGSRSRRRRRSSTRARRTYLVELAPRARGDDRVPRRLRVERRRRARRTTPTALRPVGPRRSAARIARSARITSSNERSTTGSAAACPTWR